MLCEKDIASVVLAAPETDTRAQSISNVIHWGHRRRRYTTMPSTLHPSKVGSLEKLPKHPKAIGRCPGREYES